MDWQPIETAPKDGTLVLLYSAADDWMEPAAWAHGQWEEGRGYQVKAPTHWMPLPSPPR